MSLSNGSNGPPAGSPGGARGESVIEVTELNDNFSQEPAGNKKSLMSVDLGRSSKSG